MLLFIKRNFPICATVLIFILIFGLFLHYNFFIKEYNQQENNNIIKIKIPRNEFNTLELLNFTPVLKAGNWNNDYKLPWGIKNISNFTQSSLDIAFPKWSYKPSAKIVWWAGFIYDIHRRLSHARLSYSIKFDDNFNFVKWGKLPWFCGWTCARGGASTSDWFSTRFMWRSWWDLEVYAYIPEKAWNLWKSIDRGMFQFKPGQSYKLSQEIQLNTPWQDDWLLVVEIDGAEVYRNNSMNFREKDIFLDQILFSTFFWWGDPSWAAPNDTSILFSDFKLEY